MRNAFFALAAAAVLSLNAFAGELAYHFEGGSELKVRAVAEQQAWKVYDRGQDQLIVVAAVVNGKLVVEEFKAPFTPEPNPQPNPKPDPQPNPQPGPKTVLWIEETSDRTPSQAAAVIDAQIRAALQAAKWSLRVVDKDVVDETGKPPADLAPYIESAKAAGLPRVFILQDVRELYAGAAPSSVSSFLDLLRRYGLPVGGPAEQTEQSGAPAGSRQEASPENENATEHEEQTQPMSACPTGQCPVPTAPVRQWRLFR